MKVIIDKRSGIVKYILPDTTVVTIAENYIHFDNTILTDLTANNIIVLENQTLPEYEEGTQMRYSATNGYTQHFGYGEKSLPQIKSQLRENLSAIFDEISSLVSKARLLNDPEPPALIPLIVSARAIYIKAKADIKMLTEGNASLYKVKDASVRLLISQLKDLI